MALTDSSMQHVAALSELKEEISRHTQHFAVVKDQVEQMCHAQGFVLVAPNDTIKVAQRLEFDNRSNGPRTMQLLNRDMELFQETVQRSEMRLRTVKTLLYLPEDPYGAGDMNATAAIDGAHGLLIDYLKWDAGNFPSINAHTTALHVLLGPVLGVHICSTRAAAATILEQGEHQATVRIWPLESLQQVPGARSRDYKDVLAICPGSVDPRKFIALHSNDSINRAILKAIGTWIFTQSDEAAGDVIADTAFGRRSRPGTGCISAEGNKHSRGSLSVVSTYYPSAQGSAAAQQRHGQAANPDADLPTLTFVDLVQEYHRLKESVYSARTAYKAAEATMTATRESITLTTKLVHSLTCMIELESKIDTAKEAQSRTRVLAANAQADVNRCKGDLEVLEATRDRLKDELAELHHAAASGSLESVQILVYEQNHTLMQQLLSQQADKEASIIRMKDELLQAKADLEENSSIVDAADASIQRLRRELECSHQKVFSHDMTVRSLAGEAEKLRTCLEELETSLGLYESDERMVGGGLEEVVKAKEAKWSTCVRHAGALQLIAQLPLVQSSQTIQSKRRDGGQDNSRKGSHAGLKSLRSSTSIHATDQDRLLPQDQQAVLASPSELKASVSCAVRRCSLELDSLCGPGSSDSLLANSSQFMSCMSTEQARSEESLREKCERERRIRKEIFCAMSELKLETEIDLSMSVGEVIDADEHEEVDQANTRLSSASASAAGTAATATSRPRRQQLGLSRRTIDRMHEKNEELRTMKEYLDQVCVAQFLICPLGCWWVLLLWLVILISSMRIQTNRSIEALEAGSMRFDSVVDDLNEKTAVAISSRCSRYENLPRACLYSHATLLFSI